MGSIWTCLWEAPGGQINQHVTFGGHEGMVQTPGSTAPHTHHTRSWDLSQLRIKTSAVEKLERSETPANQTSDEETVKVNPRPSTLAQKAHYVGSGVVCQAPPRPAPILRWIWSAFQRHKSFIRPHNPVCWQQLPRVRWTWAVPSNSGPGQRRRNQIHLCSPPRHLKS